MKDIDIDGTNCKIGENAKENWYLLDNAKDNFLFLHLSSFPSCYVIIEHDSPNKEIIEKAAILCKNNTKYKNLRDIKVDYTLCSNVIKTDKVGEVIFKSNKKVNKIKV